MQLKRYLAPRFELLYIAAPAVQDSCDTFRVDAHDNNHRIPKLPSEKALQTHASRSCANPKQAAPGLMLQNCWSTGSSRQSDITIHSINAQLNHSLNGATNKHAMKDKHILMLNLMICVFATVGFNWMETLRIPGIKPSAMAQERHESPTSVYARSYVWLSGTRAINNT